MSPPWWRRARPACTLLVLLVWLAALCPTAASEQPTGQPSGRKAQSEKHAASKHDQIEPPIAYYRPQPSQSTAHDVPDEAPRQRVGQSAAQLDSALLRELDRLIELHQQKVDVLLRMRHDFRDTQHSLVNTERPADSTNDVIPSYPPSADSVLSAVDIAASPAAKPPRAVNPRSSGSSEPFTLSSAIPQLVQRAAVFLAAVAVLVVYQYVQHKRAQQRPAASASSRAWEDEWLARRRRQETLNQQRRTVKAQDVAGVRRRRTGGASATGGEEEGKELRVESEVYEERDGGDWDEAVGDFWDASDERHDGYVGVFGVEDEEKDRESDEDERAASAGPGMLVDDDNDEEYEEEEGEADEELPDDDEQG